MQAELQIIPVPAFRDNYIWLIHNGTKAVAVDPGDTAPVMSALASLNLELEAILVTHHHQDHIGGIDALMEYFPHLKVFTPKQEHYTFRHHPVAEPDTFKCSDWMPETKVLDLPGHTLGHIAFYMAYGIQKWLFCGDTLFGAGCGRLFEGTPSQMLTSLHKLAALPADTSVYCTHEYTLHNINFALTVDPDNTALLQRRVETIQKRNAQLPSLPSSIALERATNPFLRCDIQSIQSALDLEKHSELDVFTKLREIRNSY